MSAERPTPESGQPPQAALLALYALLVLIFISVLVIVGVYGT